jgi:hypothetical protein
MKRAFLACTAALLALAACDHPNDPRVEATDGFGSNTLDVYSVAADSGNGWSIDNGELIGTGPVKNSLLLWNGVAIANGWVEAESRRAEDAGLVLHYIDLSNYYLLAFRDDSTKTGLATQNLALVRRTGGTFTTLQTKDVTWARGTMHTVRFEVAGSKFTVSFDGTVQFEVTEGAGASVPGRFGLRHNGTSSTWVSTFDTFRWHVPLNR